MSVNNPENKDDLSDILRAKRSIAIRRVIQSTTDALRENPKEAIPAIARNSVALLIALERRMFLNDTSEDSALIDENGLTAAARDVLKIEDSLRASLKLLADIEGLTITTRKLAAAKREKKQSAASVADVIISMDADGTGESNADCG